MPPVNDNNGQPPVEPPERLLQPINDKTAGISSYPRKKKWIGISILISLFVIILTLLVAVWFNYQHQLSPRSNSQTEAVAITIEPGSTPSQIADELEESEIIRSAMAFDIYTRLHGYRDSLQAGTYLFSAAESTPQIVSRLLSGDVDTFTITFYPGATLTDSTDKDESQKLDVTSVLRRAGFSDQEITEALRKEYESPAFATKPASADLEGYVYGETYQLNAGVTVEDILGRAFQELDTVITENNLVEKYQQKGLSLYEGITLASIIQREVSDPEDQRQVAQVFLLRLAQGMELGSDVTFVYAANKLGVEPISTLESEYNTRIHSGLPPGPISAPGLSALLAVADPASGDYLYFVAGDDGTTHFAHTLSEHNQNVANYCTVECQKP